MGKWSAWYADTLSSKSDSQAIYDDDECFYPFSTLASYLISVPKKSSHLLIPRIIDIDVPSTTSRVLSRCSILIKCNTSIIPY